MATSSWDDVVDADVQSRVVDLLPMRRGHFRFESGHHGDLWLDLELLFLNPAPLCRLAERLAEALSPHGVEAVCGPLVEGAFVALTVASALNVPFTYAERRNDQTKTGLFPVTYTVPLALRGVVHGRRVAVVNDVINAGSAVRGTLFDLKACGAKPVAIGTLAVLGSSAEKLAAEAGVALETLATIPNEVWTPETCVLCAQGVSLSGAAE